MKAAHCDHKRFAQSTLEEGEENFSFFLGWGGGGVVVFFVVGFVFFGGVIHCVGVFCHPKFVCFVWVVGFLVCWNALYQEALSV